MTLFNFDISVTVEGEDFESALSWLKEIPLKNQIDFDVIDYQEIKFE